MKDYPMISKKLSLVAFTSVLFAGLGANALAGNAMSMQDNTKCMKCMERMERMSPEQQAAPTSKSEAGSAKHAAIGDAPAYPRK